ncbi:MAG: hypothetical protein LBR11_01685 [Deltaproteobacteria bacterium]|nr:hypothetical protein [Deltaproteobacteria bacterium]
MSVGLPGQIVVVIELKYRSKSQITLTPRENVALAALACGPRPEAKRFIDLAIAIYDVSAKVKVVLTQISQRLTQPDSRSLTEP